MVTEEKIKIRKMRCKGESYARIAEILRISANTIKSFCRRNNLQNTKFEDYEMKNICKNCKASIDSGRKNKKFCSDGCRLNWWNKNSDKLRKVAIYSLKCANCGIAFESYGNKNRKFCSRSCYFNYRFDSS